MLSSKGNLKRHMKNVHKIIVGMDTQPEGSVGNHMCTECNAVFSFRWNLAKHMSMVHRKNWDTSREEYHITTKRSPTKQKEWYNRHGYECSKCPTQFSYRGNLNQH